MAQGKLKIHTENILPIIKKWLYSDKEIFVRELISNACDALGKLKILSNHGGISLQEEQLRIDLIVDKEKRTLQFIDTGIGMSAEEVEKYIAQIAFSGAEEFLSKYQSKNEQDQIIGHFGLGFYSAYMVSEKVEIDTLSYQENAEPVFWSCDGSSSYTIEQGSRTARGTQITLHIAPDSAEFLEEGRLSQILQQYCAYLPFPITLNGVRINDKEPLWMKNAAECSDAEYLQFYRKLYPLEPDPIFWIHLNVDYPFHLKGILYFPHIHRKFDWTQQTIKLFCNRVFVSDNCKDLIPDYLMCLRGAIDSPDIPLNVSRSYLQMDRTVRQLSTHISKKVSDRLTALYEQERERFLTAWPHVEMVVKLGILQDNKFYERAKEFLIWKNLSGEWKTLDQYLEKHPGKVFYTSDDKHQAHFLDLYTNKGIEVLYAGSPVDTALIHFLEDKCRPVQFQRIDGAIDDTILDAAREKTLLDADGKTEAMRIAHFIGSHLDIPVEARSLASESLPAFIVVDEDTRRMRDYFALSGQKIPSEWKDKRTLVVNTNSKLIASLYALKDPALAKEMVSHLYELSLLAQKELDPAHLSAFVSRSTHLMENLLSAQTVS